MSMEIQTFFRIILDPGEEISGIKGYANGKKNIV